MSEHNPVPFQRFFDLHDLTETGSEVHIVATAEQRAALARWAEVEGVDKFEATVSLQKQSLSRFSFAANLSADIVQACVVTLEPVHSHIEARIDRALHLSVPRRAMRLDTKRGEPEPPPVLDDDGPEEIDSPHYDLAGPLLEEFSLAIDPYPRASGVAFEAPVARDSGKPESPFAVLKGLKRKGG
jgi:hypothetical protein